MDSALYLPHPLKDYPTVEELLGKFCVLMSLKKTGALARSALMPSAAKPTYLRIISFNFTTNSFYAR